MRRRRKRRKREGGKKREHNVRELDSKKRRDRIRGGRKIHGEERMRERESRNREHNVRELDRKQGVKNRLIATGEDITGF